MNIATFMPFDSITIKGHNFKYAETYRIIKNRKFLILETESGNKIKIENKYKKFFIIENSGDLSENYFNFEYLSIH